MKKHFFFGDRSSFHGAESVELAALILRSSASTNKRLKDDLGISIEYDGSDSRTSHDGRKVGICAFQSADVELVVTVAPKVETLRIRAILESFGTTSTNLPQLRLDDVVTLSGVSHSNADFSVTFLLTLLRDIIDAATLLNELTHVRHRKYIHGGIKGRPLLEKSLTDMLLGRAIGFTCETLSDIHLDEYKRVALATGLAASDALGVWSGVLTGTWATKDLKKSKILQAFPGINPNGVTLATVLKVCRPPFPFGIKDLLYRCLRFWTWHSNYRISDSRGTHERFHSLSIDLDRIFERYVRLVADQASDGLFDFMKNRTFYYERKIDGLSSKRPIILDCLLHSPAQSKFFVLEAKYSDKVGEPDHLFQVVTYASYCYSALPAKGRAAIIVYPGDEWSIGEIIGFDVPIFILKIPVPSSKAVPNLRVFLEGLEEKCTTV